MPALLKPAALSDIIPPCTVLQRQQHLYVCVGQCVQYIIRYRTVCTPMCADAHSTVQVLLNRIIISSLDFSLITVLL